MSARALLGPLALSCRYALLPRSHMPPLRHSLLRPFAAAVSAGVALSGLTLLNGSASASAAPTALHVDFGPKSSSAPHGYVVDYGRAWSASRGYGWTKAGTEQGALARRQHRQALVAAVAGPPVRLADPDAGGRAATAPPRPASGRRPSPTASTT